MLTFVLYHVVVLSLPYVLPCFLNLGYTLYFFVTMVFQILLQLAQLLIRAS